MLLPRFRFLAPCGLLCLVATSAGAAEPAILAKARAWLGPEAALDAVRTIHYVGTLIGPDPAQPGKELRQQIEIFLQKPAQQRIELRSDRWVEVSALDDYEAWRRTTDAKDPGKWEQSQLSPDQVKQQRADVWQNLSFFRGLERVGGHIEDQGPATIDGIACEKIAFFHSDSLVFFRYFNQQTGELVYTGTAENNIREQGEIIAGGIRFPKKINIAQTVDGRTTTRSITFDRITLNETFPPRLFSVPLPTLK